MEVVREEGKDGQNEYMSQLLMYMYVYVRLAVLGIRCTLIVSVCTLKCWFTFTTFDGHSEFVYTDTFITYEQSRTINSSLSLLPPNLSPHLASSYLPLSILSGLMAGDTDLFLARHVAGDTNLFLG